MSKDKTVKPVKPGVLNVGALRGLAGHAHERALGYLIVPIDDVVSKEQVRKNFRNIEGLAQTIKNDKQQTPIAVAPKNADGKYVILRGERRWRACKLAGLTEVKISIDDTKYTESGTILSELVENVQRDGLTPLELAEALNKLVRLGETQVELAKKLGKSHSYITMHLAIGQNLPDKVSKLYHAGHEMSAEALYNLSLAAKSDPAVVDQLCEAALQEGRPITRSESRSVLRGVSEKAAPEEVATKAAPPAQSEEEPVAPKEEPESLGSSDDDDDDDDESSFAGESNTRSSEGTESTTKTVESKAQPTPQPKKSIVSVFVTVAFEGEYRSGKLSLNRKPPREGHAFVELEDGTYKSFPVLDIKLLDVQSDEGNEDSE